MFRITRRILVTTIVMVGFATTANAKGPPASLAKKDIRKKLDPKWVAKATSVKLTQKGKMQTRDSYLRRRDLKKTTFYGWTFNVTYTYKDGGSKVCEMDAVYYKKGGWKLYKVIETAECRKAAGAGQAAPGDAALISLVKPEIDKFLRGKASKRTPYFNNANITNVKLQKIAFKSYKQRFWYTYGGSFDVGTHHCNTCTGKRCKELVSIKKENSSAPWKVSVRWPHCKQK